MIFRRLARFAFDVAVILVVTHWVAADFYTALMAQLHAPQRIGTAPTLGLLTFMVVLAAVVYTIRALLRFLTNAHPVMECWAENTAWTLRNRMADCQGTGKLTAWIPRHVTSHPRYAHMSKTITQMCAAHPVLNETLGENVRRDLCRAAFIEDDLFNPNYQRDILLRAAQLRPGMIFDSGVVLNALYQDSLGSALGFTTAAHGTFILRETPTSAYQRVQDRLFVAAANVIQNAYTGDATPARKKLLIEARSAADAGFVTPSGLSKPKAIAAYAMTEASCIVSDVVSTTPLEAVL